MIFCLLIFPFQAMAAKIVVDAGHGGKDPGAIGVNGLEEKAVNLDIAQKLRDILIGKGYDVFMTRNTDMYISLGDRVEMTNEQNPDLFVSIHANSYSNRNTQGAMVLYYDNELPQSNYPASEAMEKMSPESKKLAQAVLKSIVGTVDVVDKGLLPSAAYVIRMGQVPSILVETAFLSNSSDAAMLADETTRSKFAAAIGAGIEAYHPIVRDKAPNVLPDTIGHWSREAVLQLQEKGIVEGAGNRFEPNRALTRAEWVTMLSRLYPQKLAPNPNACGQSVTAAVYNGGCTDKPAAKDKQMPSYSDLKNGHWAFALLQQAAAAGIIDGYADGTIRPDQPVTRSEAAVLLARLMEPKAAWDGATPFADVGPRHWAAKAIYTLRQAGIVDGVTNGSFMPDKSITRGEAAALLNRAAGAL
ncbi:N-acetylmuramoyl-L-alanine amidase [Paenibacillus thalictri]|uniref:N-acetylmuramoyl-L-alanine amidase n=2 Tax=Paenibacillus thalictri TaxID=2527873 RepID=A0A4Q9DXM4_9BACL|nr:N-acetylmuramoyl-L-alanine amidase [Paenibacillus thalictri]